MTFSLHTQLQADTLAIGDLALSSVLLMNDARFAWLILVPRVPDARDLIDLDRGDYRLLTDEIDRVSRGLKAHAGSDKLNVAALGNMVPQLHVHVIARHVNDAAWPAPVWGNGQPVPYTSDAATARIAHLRTELGISG